MGDKPKSALRIVLEELGTLTGGVALIGFILHKLCGFADSVDSAGIALAILVLASWAITGLLRLLAKRWQKDGKPVIGIDLSGYWASLVFGLVVGTFYIAGYYSFPWLKERLAPEPQRPATIVLESIKNADELPYRNMVPYRDWLADSAGDKPIKLVTTEPLQGPTPEYGWSFGPAGDVDTAFIFLVPARSSRDDAILVLQPAKIDSGDMAVKVPAFSGTEKYRLLILVRTHKDTNIYSGAVK